MVRTTICCQHQPAFYMLVQRRAELVCHGEHSAQSLTVKMQMPPCMVAGAKHNEGFAFPYYALSSVHTLLSLLTQHISIC